MEARPGLLQTDHAAAEWRVARRTRSASSAAAPPTASYLSVGAASCEQPAFPDAEMLRAMTLRELRDYALDHGLSLNEVDDTGMRAFALAALGGAFPQLRHLYLNRNRMGDDGVIALADALRGGALSSLRLLTLHDTAVADKGCKALAKSVSHLGRAQLSWLNLSRTMVNSAETKLYVQKLLGAGHRCCI